MDWPGLVGQTDGALLKALGILTTYRPSAGPAISVAGIFDAAYVRVGVGEAGVSSSGPAVFYRLGNSSAVVNIGGIDCLLELPVDPTDDDPTITVNSVGYQVVEPEKDGQGGVLLHLHLR